MTRNLVASLALLALIGCASIPLPSDRLERTQASLRGAEELGASSVPQAKLHLQFAKDETEAATRMASRGDDRALLTVACAESDAELALVLAREVQIHGQAIQAVEDLKAVQARANPY